VVELFCYLKEIARNAVALKEVLARAEELQQEEDRALASVTHTAAYLLAISSDKSVMHS